MLLSMCEECWGPVCSSAEIADHLLQKAHIVVTDGEGFGADGFLRFSYATSMANLERAVAAMKEIFLSNKPPSLTKHKLVPVQFANCDFGSIIDALHRWLEHFRTASINSS